ncbi:tRNA pseudouridine(38-40) synthase TruA [Sulfurovum sp. bin170]|uniref:tRNA pseudouridine(38-40) synthase TruA n=1 Tax=Sulfurovum sp. bin170 TaxID=2695268 RepID=UPI0013DEFF04|nr:tRNA pseudouridine(38-40) synthase TruA [Sulfurovum sp. bin170]NEW60527.1 tRNA pseudouridine(38-40) synthase TruA [Sulfurovum sp. bin170]
MRVKAVIAYDGGYFKGFQKQKSTKYTVTTAIESALISLGIDSEIRGSGRTDAGVHATGQVIDFELPDFWKDLTKLKEVLNRKLKHISFKHISKVKDDFHSRFSAKRRIYRYIFKTTRPSIFEEKYIAYYPVFSEKLLQQALKKFEGEHDFSNFLKTGTITHSNIRTIYRARYKKYNNYHIIYFEANGFLRSQVRMMTEVAMQVALEQFSIEQLQEQLEVKKRYITTLAPPEGLYLARIIY